nr:hypothetical protein [Actinomycetota bacterium]
PEPVVAAVPEPEPVVAATSAPATGAGGANGTRAAAGGRPGRTPGARQGNLVKGGPEFQDIFKMAMNGNSLADSVQVKYDAGSERGRVTTGSSTPDDDSKRRRRRKR